MSRQNRKGQETWSILMSSKEKMSPPRRLIYPEFPTAQISWIFLLIDAKSLKSDMWILFIIHHSRTQQYQAEPNANQGIRKGFKVVKNRSSSLPRTTALIDKKYVQLMLEIGIAYKCLIRQVITEPSDNPRFKSKPLKIAFWRDVRRKNRETLKN